MVRYEVRDRTDEDGAVVHALGPGKIHAKLRH
jgi:hypothetical protein